MNPPTVAATQKSGNVGAPQQLASDAQVQGIQRQANVAGPVGMATRGLLKAMSAYQNGPGGQLDLHALPADVAQQILDARGKASEEFFKSWSASIAENAKADKEAATRREKLKPMIERAFTKLGGFQADSPSHQQRTPPTPPEPAHRSTSVPSTTTVPPQRFSLHGAFTPPS